MHSCVSALLVVLFAWSVLLLKILWPDGVVMDCMMLLCVSLVCECVQLRKGFVLMVLPVCISSSEKMFMRRGKALMGLWFCAFFQK